MLRQPLVMGIALALSACAKPPAAPPPPTAPAADASLIESAKAPVSDEKLAWLEGDWCGGEDGETIEESWFAPVKNEAIGMSRTLRGGRMISYEYMRIMDLEGTITFVGQPGGDVPTNFKRTDGGDDWIRFENKEHDYPQRIEYRRVGEELHAEIGGPGEGDKEEVVPFSYKRCGK